MAREFKSRNAQSVTLLNPSKKHRYTFVMDKSIKAIYNGVWHEEDENWMVCLCTKAGRELLIEVDAPKDVAVDVTTKLTEYDILGTGSDLEEHPIVVNPEGIDMEERVALENMDAVNAEIEARNKALPEEVIVEEEEELPEYSEKIEGLLSFVAAHPSLSDEDLLGELKVEYRKEPLVEMCEELNLSIEGVKKDLIGRLLSELLE